MVLLQPKLSLRLAQKQILTPGLVQMVSVLALNKLELKDMINAEMVENPVLDELDSQVPLLDEVAEREAERDHGASESADESRQNGNDPFDEIDFGSFFQDYLDPGYRSPAAEVSEKPSFENFISRPTTLTDHLMWQLGAAHVRPQVYAAAELVIGNLNEDGYLTATEDELLGVARSATAPLESAEVENHETEEGGERSCAESASPSEMLIEEAVPPADSKRGVDGFGATSADTAMADEALAGNVVCIRGLGVPDPLPFDSASLAGAIELVQQMDPVGVAARDLRECLLLQLRYHREVHCQHGAGNGRTEQVLEDAIRITADHLKEVQNKQFREIAKAIERPVEAVNEALDFIKTLDPKPGLRYNKVEPRLIEPDVAFVKQGEDYIVIMNEDDLPQLRLNPTYRRLLNRNAAEKEVRSYVKERYKSAIQLIKNIEQRKQTILKVCYAIIRRQKEVLDFGIDHLKPMMIKDVAEEIGVHPSTVSRAVANKYTYTPQGVFELRYFFSESVNGPEGENTSLLILKRRVKKLIEDEDPTRPLTDELITRILQSQGIQVTRRTVAKYREDMRIPSTHQRRVKK